MDLPLGQARLLRPSHPYARNRLLAALPHADRAALVDGMEPVSLDPSIELIKAHRSIPYAYFPTSGLVSIVTAAVETPIEIGVVGREGVIGLPAILGSDRALHSYVVQISGAALRIETPVLLGILQERPALVRLFGLFAHFLVAQVGQTACANANLKIQGRLARWLLMAQDRTESAQLMLTHEALSVMLGVRRPGVTDAIHLLEGDGAIRAQRGRITVLDRKRLIDLAGVSYGLAEAEYDRLFPAI